jgi:pyruvate kinase
MRKVKIVCTLGPSTEGPARLAELIAAGMDVARLNLSHGDRESHLRAYRDLRAAAAAADRPVAALFDLGGPKIRVGAMKDGAVRLERGARVRLTSEPVLGTAERISHSYVPLARDVKAGEPILLDDGLFKLEVESVVGADVVCRVVDGGLLKDRKGMNLPGSKLSVPALTEKDRQDIDFARELGADYIAISFVRRPEDVLEAKALAGEIPVIAKIEKPEAVERLQDILDVADGAMVARGDLGVEAGHEKVPLIQKKIIRDVKVRAKPVITATQMLDSMIQNPRPTRAEVSDVANAVIDGTDAVMLSGETSVGAWPVEAVRTLTAIIGEIEGHPDGLSCLKPPDVRERTFSRSIADAAAEVARNLGLAALAIYTESGHSAALVSAHRPVANIVAFSRHQRVLNRLALYWGVLPLYGEWVHGVEGVVRQAEAKLRKYGMVRPGDDIAVTFATQVGDEPFQTNVLKLWKVTAE